MNDDLMQLWQQNQQSAPDPERIAQELRWHLAGDFNGRRRAAAGAGGGGGVEML